MSAFDFDKVEKIIGYKFKDKDLLCQCFTHASYGNEHNTNDNELLEFFGDSILGFIVTEHLFKNGYGDEGDLTDKRKTIVSKTPLLNMIMKLKLNKYVLLGNGQKNTSHNDEKLYSSVYEALVAGLYIDGGLSEAKRFIKETLIKDYESKREIIRAEIREEIKKNESKNKFQEYVQKNKLGEITYETLGKTGPDHRPNFKVAVMINGKNIAEGEGRSKKDAESHAAEEALQRIEKRKNEEQAR